MPARRAGQFTQDAIDAIPSGGSETFAYFANVTKSQDGQTIVYGGGGWTEVGAFLAANASASSPAWHRAAFVNSAFTSTSKNATLSTLPIGPYADYASLRTAVHNGEVRQVAVRILEVDADQADSDHGTVVLPNANGFYHSAGTWDVFPGWALSVDPVRFRVHFGSTHITVSSDADIPTAPIVQLSIGIWA